MTGRDEGAPPLWASVHLYFNGALHGCEGDNVITRVAVPFAELCLAGGTADRYFFVRYSDPEPHIRLRIRVRREMAHNLASQLRRDHVGSALTGVSVVPYERELARYGGPWAMDEAEEVFCVSSHVAHELVTRSPPDDRDARRGQAALAMIVVLGVMYRTPRTAMRFLKRYSTGYLRYVAGSDAVRSELQNAFRSGYERQGEILRRYVLEAWQRTGRGTPLSAALDAYFSALVLARARLVATVAAGRFVVGHRTVVSARIAFDHIVPSYLHMMNNRLGITILDEAYLASGLSQALSTLTAQGASAR